MNIPDDLTPLIVALFGGAGVIIVETLLKAWLNRSKTQVDEAAALRRVDLERDSFTIDSAFKLMAAYEADFVKLRDRIGELERKLAERDGQIAKMEQELGERDLLIANLQEQVGALRDEIERISRQVNGGQDADG